MNGVITQEIAQFISDIYDLIEEVDPEISTERLIAMTTDMTNLELHTDYNSGDIVRALVMSGSFKPAQK